jgi:hypothetical protein
LWINGTQKTIANTGSYTTSIKGGSTTAYKICDAAGCSNVVSVVT